VSGRPNYLLDTNILSDTRRKKPEGRVVSFLSSVDPSTLYISVLTLGKLRKGIAARKKIDPDTADRLGAWVDGLEYSFEDRILGIDAGVARIWGELSAERPRPVIDTLLGATATVHKLVLVTRNTRDFEGMGVKLLDPWKL
jgi:predicted nucleic acid-binding protein